MKKYVVFKKIFLLFSMVLLVTSNFTTLAKAEEKLVISNSKVEKYVNKIIETVEYSEDNNSYKAIVTCNVDNVRIIEVYKNGSLYIYNNESFDYFRAMSIYNATISPRADGYQDVYIGTTSKVEEVGGVDSTGLTLAIISAVPMPYNFALAMASVAVSMFSGGSGYFLKTTVDTYEQWSWGTTASPSYFLGWYWMNATSQMYGNRECTGQHIDKYYSWTGTTPGIV